MQIDTLSASYLLTDSGLQKGSLDYYGKITDTHITPSELSCFVPSLKDLNNSISIATNFRGSDSEVHVPSLLVSATGHELDLNVNGWISDWQQRPAWNVQINRLAATEGYLNLLAKVFPQIPSQLTTLGDIQIQGACNRDKQGAGALQTDIHTSAGDAKVAMNLTADQTFGGTVDINELNLQKILGDNNLGKLTSALKLNGMLHEEQKPDVNVEGVVSQLDYKGYSYHNLALAGGYNKGIITSNLDINDPHLEAQIEATNKRKLRGRPYSTQPERCTGKHTPE